jgi:hypothetical protein
LGPKEKNVNAQVSHHDVFARSLMISFAHLYFRGIKERGES